MEIKEFEKVLKAKKQSERYTGFLLNVKGKVIKVSQDRKKFFIYKTFKGGYCSKCGRLETEKDEGIEVYFYKKQENLSIFQAEMLFFIFYMGKIPRDYANYHKCKAGMKFINNIKNVNLVTKKCEFSNTLNKEKMLKKYRLVERGELKQDTIHITKEQIIELYKEIKGDSKIKGFICPIEKIKK